MEPVMHIMIVDDDGDDTGFLKNAFLKHRTGIRFTECKNGKQALEKLSHAVASGPVADEYPHLIFLDLYMPGMDGIQTLTEIKKKREAAHIPVMVISACMLKRDEERCYAAGCEKFLIKPMSMEEYEDTAAAAIHFLVERQAGLPAIPAFSNQGLENFDERLNAFGQMPVS